MVPVKVAAELPQDDKKYLFYDSTNIVKDEELLTAEEYEQKYSWLFDTWLKPHTY